MNGRLGKQAGNMGNHQEKNQFTSLFFGFFGGCPFALFVSQDADVPQIVSAYFLLV